MSEEDSEKREQERLLRTMTKVGSRGRSGSTAPSGGGAARPVSWNVNLTGRAAGGSMKKKRTSRGAASTSRAIEVGRRDTYRRSQKRD